MDRRRKKFSDRLYAKSNWKIREGGDVLTRRLTERSSSMRVAARELDARTTFWGCQVKYQPRGRKTKISNEEI